MAVPSGPGRWRLAALAICLLSVARCSAAASTCTASKFFLYTSQSQGYHLGVQLRCQQPNRMEQV